MNQLATMANLQRVSAQQLDKSKAVLFLSVLKTTFSLSASLLRRLLDRFRHGIQG